MNPSNPYAPVVGVIILFVVAWNLRGDLLSIFSGLRTRLSSLGVKVDPAIQAHSNRRRTLDHLDEAFNYFESVKCQEGMASIRTAIQHAYEDHEA